MSNGLMIIRILCAYRGAFLTAMCAGSICDGIKEWATDAISITIVVARVDSGQ